MAKAKAIVVNGRIITKRSISETDLLTVETARSRVAWLKSQLADAERACISAEAEVIAMLEAGCRVRSAKLSAGLREKIGARRPEWKDLYLGHMEDAHGVPRAAEEAIVLNCTAGKPKQELFILHKVVQ